MAAEMRDTSGTQSQSFQQGRCVDFIENLTVATPKLVNSFNNVSGGKYWRICATSKKGLVIR
jgi:hypothetical protein